MITWFTLLMIGHIICLLFTVTKKKFSPFLFTFLLPFLSLFLIVKCFLKNKVTILDVIYKLSTFFIIIKLLIFLFLFIIFILWISQCGFNILYKLDRQKLPKKLFSVYGNFGILIFMNIAWMVVVLWIFFDIRYVFFLFSGRNLKTLAKENKQKNLK